MRESCLNGADAMDQLASELALLDQDLSPWSQLPWGIFYWGDNRFVYVNRWSSGEDMPIASEVPAGEGDDLVLCTAHSWTVLGKGRHMAAGDRIDLLNSVCDEMSDAERRPLPLVVVDSVERVCRLGTFDSRFVWSYANFRVAALGSLPTRSMP